MDSNGILQKNPFRYRGYYYDRETGFYFLQSRYYDPALGRFLNADVLLAETGDGTGHNLFAYCLNNPVNMEDENGQFAFTAAIAVGVSIVVGGCISGLESVAKNGGFWEGFAGGAANGALASAGAVLSIMGAAPIIAFMGGVYGAAGGALAEYTIECNLENEVFDSEEAAERTAVAMCVGGLSGAVPLVDGADKIVVGVQTYLTGVYTGAITMIESVLSNIDN